MDGLERRLFDERLVEKVAEYLSPQGAVALRAHWRALEAEPPSVSGYGIEPIDYIPPGLAKCQEKLKKVLARLKWLREVHFLQASLERRARGEARRLEQENQVLKEQIQEQNKQQARLQRQLHSLLGLNAKSKKKTPDEPSAHADTPENARREKPPKPRGAPRGHRGATRALPQHVDRIETIPPPQHCPHCGAHDVREENDWISKYIEDIPPIVKTVVEKRYRQGRCAHCNEIVIAPQAWVGPPVSIGPNLTATLTLLRQQMGASYRKLSRFATDVCQIPLTPAGVWELIQRVSTQLTPLYRGLEAALPTQSVMHADETGWKVDAKRWYLWCFCNQALTFYHADPSRAAQVVKSFLGDHYSGLLHSDFYAAYDAFPHTQKCLVHFLRDIHNELEIVPEDQALKRLKQTLTTVIERGGSLQVLPESRDKEKALKALDQKLAALERLSSNNERTQTLLKRAKKYRPSLLRFVSHPQGAFHNNLAERRIRPAVIARKISFGNRSPDGARNSAILNSVLETWRLKGNNLQGLIHRVLNASALQRQQLTRELLDTS